MEDFEECWDGYDRADICVRKCYASKSRIRNYLSSRTLGRCGFSPAEKWLALLDCLRISERSKLYLYAGFSGVLSSTADKQASEFSRSIAPLRDALNEKRGAVSAETAPRGVRL